MTTEIRYRNCTLCEAHCGIAVEVDADARQVVSIRGDADDHFSGGFICPKAYGLKGLYEDPDRLRRPLRKRAGKSGDAWDEIGWDEAFALVAERLGAVRAEHGADALGTYLGNPSVHDLGANLFLPALLRALGTRRRFSASSVDQLPKQLSSLLLFGNGGTIPVPDVDRTAYMLILGANPVVSNGSLMTAPDMPGRLKRLRARGGKFVVIDPRRSETAALADEHHFIRPGSDALFLLSLISVLFAEDLVDLGRVAPLVRNLDELRALAGEFSPDRTGSHTGIPAAVCQRLAREMAAAESAVCYGRIGTCTQAFGTLASWLVDCVTALTGNLDAPGGAMFPEVAARASAPKAGRVPYARWHSLRGLPEAFGELPVATLAEEIEGQGEQRIRALLTMAGNPVLSCPNGARLSEALRSLSFMVSVDIYLNETTRFADVILPPHSALETDNYELVFNSLAVRNQAKLSPRAIEPSSDTRPQWFILAELAGRMMGLPKNAAATVERGVLDFVLEAGLAQRKAAGSAPPSKAEAVAALGDEPGPLRILDAMLRTGAYGDGFVDGASEGVGAGERGPALSLARLRQAPHGIDLGPLRPHLAKILATADGTIDLAPALLVNDAERLRALLAESPRTAAGAPAEAGEGEGEGAGEMLLIGRRQLRNNNSWMGNIHALAKGRERCTLLVHPSDAERLGLRDGGSAQVRSRVGAIEVPVQVSDEVMPGVVSLPHGFGHDVEGTRLRVAREHAGVNSNLLTDEAAVDVLSGNSVLSGIPVAVQPAP